MLSLCFFFAFVSHVTASGVNIKFFNGWNTKVSSSVKLRVCTNVTYQTDLPCITSALLQYGSEDKLFFSQTTTIQDLYMTLLDTNDNSLLQTAVDTGLMYDWGCTIIVATGTFEVSSSNVVTDKPILYNILNDGSDSIQSVRFGFLITFKNNTVVDSLQLQSPTWYTYNSAGVQSGSISGPPTENPPFYHYFYVTLTLGEEFYAQSQDNYEWSFISNTGATVKTFPTGACFLSDGEVWVSVLYGNGYYNSTPGAVNLGPPVAYYPSYQPTSAPTTSTPTVTKSPTIRPSMAPTNSSTPSSIGAGEIIGFVLLSLTVMALTVCVYYLVYKEKHKMSTKENLNDVEMSNH